MHGLVHGKGGVNRTPRGAGRVVHLTRISTQPVQRNSFTGKDVLDLQR